MPEAELRQGAGDPSPGTEHLLSPRAGSALVPQGHRLREALQLHEEEPQRRRHQERLALQAGTPPCHPLPAPQTPGTTRNAALTAPPSQASSGVKQWNKRWFVLVDRCLFYYKGTATPVSPEPPAACLEQSQALSLLQPFFPGVCRSEGLIPSFPRLPGSSRARPGAGINN